MFMYIYLEPFIITIIIITIVASTSTWITGIQVQNLATNILYFKAIPVEPGTSIKTLKSRRRNQETSKKT